MSVDPHAENYYSASPLSYVENNPIIRIDPDGMDWYSFTNEDGVTSSLWQEGDAQTAEVDGVTYTNIGASFAQTLADGSIVVYNQNEVSNIIQVIDSNPANAHLNGNPAMVLPLALGGAFEVGVVGELGITLTVGGAAVATMVVGTAVALGVATNRVMNGELPWDIPLESYPVMRSNPGLSPGFVITDGGVKQLNNLIDRLFFAKKKKVENEESSEHTKNKRPSTKSKHEKGQKRKSQKYNDKKRNQDSWKPRK